MKTRNLAIVVVLLTAGAMLRLWPLPSASAVEKRVPAGSATVKKASAKNVPAKLKPLPRFVSAETIETLRALRGGGPPPVLQPLANGQPLPDDIPGLPGADPSAAEAFVPPTAQTKKGDLLAQVFPRPVTPARVRPAARPIIPRWVRYPLEWQLAGMSIGSRVLNKDRFNRIDRYSLMSVHGSPTAIVVPGAGAVSQQPPEVAQLFPGSEMPGWAQAINVSLDNNHTEWLYNRGTYAMGFVADRFGFIDAIVVAGVYSPIARTQMEDPLHTVKLSDDFRTKVLYRYGYPDTMETYQVNAVASGGANVAFRTFEVRYEQSYNVVFSIVNLRVVRIYIFGDPDFFNAQRRKQLRERY